MTEPRWLSLLALIVITAAIVMSIGAVLKIVWLVLPAMVIFLIFAAIIIIPGIIAMIQNIIDGEWH